MPLENAQQPYQLVETNPPAGDPALQGYLHLQMIKRMLRLGYLGSYSLLTDVRAITAPAGATFYYNFGYYQVGENYYGSSTVENTEKMINLNNGKKAYRLDGRFWLGVYQGETPVKPGSFTAFRYPVIRTLKGASTTFPEAAATAAMPAGVPVPGDICQYETESGSPRLTETRYHNGSVWIKTNIESNGSFHNFGGFSASRVMTPQVIATQVRSDKLELVGTTNMEVRNPDGFGPDNLFYWFGKKAGLIDGNGEVMYTLLTKANAYLWGQVGTTGAVTGGGTDNPNLPPTPTTGGDIPANINMAAIYGSSVTAYNGVTADSFVTLTLRTDGTFSYDVNGDITGFPLTGNYVTTPAAGVGALYEYKVTAVSGDALLTGYVGTYTPISSNRVISLGVSSAGAAVSKSSVFTLEIREIGTPANQEAKQLTFNVYARSFAGSEP